MISINHPLTNIDPSNVSGEFLALFVKASRFPQKHPLPRPPPSLQHHKRQGHLDKGLHLEQAAIGEAANRCTKPWVPFNYIPWNPLIHEFKIIETAILPPLWAICLEQLVKIGDCWGSKPKAKSPKPFIYTKEFAYACLFSLAGPFWPDCWCLPLRNLPCLLLAERWFFVRCTNDSCR